MDATGAHPATADEAARARVMAIIATSSLRALKAAGRLAEPPRALPPTGEVKHEGDMEPEDRALELLSTADAALKTFAAERLHDTLPAPKLRLPLARITEHLATITRAVAKP